MLDIRIRTRNSEFDGELDDSTDMALALWFALPLTSTINMLGDSFFFELPEFTVQVEGERQKEFHKGDIAYWPGVNALVVMFGPTPLSGEDGEPVWSYGLIKIGHLKGDDLSALSDAGDRQKVTILQNLEV